MNEIKELREEFKKYGDKFTQMGYNPETEMYLYKRKLPAGVTYYEVFKRRIGHEYKQTDKKCITYPGNEDFGQWAKCCRSLDMAMEYYNNGIKRENLQGDRNFSHFLPKDDISIHFEVKAH